MEAPLSSLFHRALTSAAKAADLPTIEDETQVLVQSALSDLRTVDSRVSTLSLFSPNDQLADIATRDLVYLLVPYVISEVEGRIRTIDPEERLERVQRAQRYLQRFLASLETYEIVPESEKALYAHRTSTITDAVKRREVKIKQYQKEKELKAQIAAVRKRRHQTSVQEPTSDLELIASLLPDPFAESSSNIEEDDADIEDILREATLLLLRLTYAQAHAQLESLSQELELLRNMPSRPPADLSAADDPRRAKTREVDDMWRLDRPAPQGGPDGKGPLLDPSGKPLRPFTILPSNAAERARLQAQVFGPGHRLPTMTVDEYLEIEQQRGNIITGGGPQSEQEPTSKEQLAIDAEMDGTAYGEEKAEEKRQKDESWAQYTDTHQRGAGNTMNRG
ncbi:TAP42-like protein [Obba rivulosa]|uniref:TAP42-like protein n=1 Tax=Obba rivulosa TaxID=1052685 RepID=A0A8E2DQD3_9APHY|nr:TAP42-like protein [Obba rivulosa]